MAAIIHPHHLPESRLPVRRPELRLVPGDRTPPATVRPWAAAFAVVVLLVVMAGAVAIGRGALAGLAPSPPPASAPAVGAPGAPGGTEVVVEAGDTVWSIARRLQPTGDVRPLVDRLVAANGSVIHAGDRLVVPA